MEGSLRRRYECGEGWKRKSFKKLVMSSGQNELGVFLSEVHKGSHCG